ncbi:MAG TPA: hypothetical protein VH374_21365 [Polyangia bacterium]|jgi:hypothetical protein|nr:hypothetical protein [Polyangia bacterium]
MMTMSAGAMRIGFLVLVIGGCGSCATSSDRDRPPQQKQLIRAVEPPVRSTPPVFIPEAARALLRMRMATHAKDMSDLMSAVVNLRYVDAEALAGEIVDDASLARPIGNDATELNALLPPEFFALQDRARDDARAVATGAHGLSAIDLGKAYGRLSEDCVACHALFRPAGERPLR